jgi:Na+-translocating ferredoxin:NAD+ oxidoreductase subunit E
MKEDFTRGLFKENPVFVLLLGLCPALAVTTKVINGIGMGFAVTFVLLASSICVSVLKDIIPEKLRFPAYIVIITFFVTCVDLFMQAYSPVLSRNLGIFIKLIAANCLILGRLESFSGSKNLGPATADALGMGVGFTLSLVLISLIREVLGSGMVTLFPVGNFDGHIILGRYAAAPIRVLGLSAGAFFVVGYLKAFFNWNALRKPPGGDSK